MELMGSFWIDYIAKQSNLPSDEVEKRTRVQDWKHEVEFFDLGIFVPFLRAESAKTLVLNDSGLIVYRRLIGEIKPQEKEAHISFYSYERYKPVFLMHLQNEFRLVDSRGYTITPSKFSVSSWERMKDQHLQAARLI